MSMSFSPIEIRENDMYDNYIVDVIVIVKRVIWTSCMNSLSFSYMESIIVFIIIICMYINHESIYIYIYIGKNAHTPLKLLTTGQKTPLTFLLANLLLKLFTTAKLILQLVTR